MPKPKAERAVVIAQFVGGDAAYLNGARSQIGEGKHFTKHKRWAWKFSPDQAAEKVSDLHMVKAQGHYWQNVEYFRWAKMKD